MVNEGIASLLSHPLGAILLTAIIAAITAALVVKLLIRRPPAAAGLGSVTAAGVRRASVPVDDDRAVVAAIVGAVVATVGAHRIVQISSAEVGSNWTTELRSRHHASHTPH